MATKLDREQLTRLVEPHWRRLYNFVFRLTLDRDRAERYLADIFALAVAAESIPTEGVEVWLLGLANTTLEQRLPRQPEVNFDILDDTLRNEATRTDVVRSLSDPQRDFLLWELKQGCMTAVINCLPPGERAAFVVCHVLKLARRRRRRPASGSPRAPTRSGCRARARRSATTWRRAASTSIR